MLSVAYVIVVALGLFLLLVPGIWLAVAFAVSVPALLLERVGPFAAFGRSFRLVRGRWWATFGTLIVGYVLVGIIAALVQGIVMVVPSVLADGNTLVGVVSSVVGGTLGAVITTPYSAAVVALIYFDLRVRKEGLDLQLIAQGADVERDPDAPLPAPFAGSRVERGPGGERYWSPTPAAAPPPPGRRRSNRPGSPRRTSRRRAAGSRRARRSPRAAATVAVGRRAAARGGSSGGGDSGGGSSGR